MKKGFRKILKYTFILVFGLLITANLFILLSGRLYLYKGVANTYLVGKTGPTIYDMDIFAHSTIKSSRDDFALKLDKNYNKIQLSTKDDKYLKKHNSKALLILRGDTLLYEEYWGQHTKETVSNSFSVAKTIVALLIGIAIEEGKIESLDESVSTYIHEFKTDGREVITIRHLLAMASGLDWEESAKNPLSDNAESYYGSNLYSLTTSQSLINEPGKKFDYQSGNSQLLGYIIENATGKDLSEYAEEKIWKEIGAEHDAFWSLDKEGGDEKAFCCMYATARDFARLGLLLLNRGKVNDKQVIPLWYFHEMISPSLMGTEDGIPNYRYGLHIWTYQSNGKQVNYCRGIKGQYIITIPEENLVIVRLGEEKKINYSIPKNRLNDSEFIEKNKYKVGHTLGLFEYIRIGKWMASKTNKD